MLSIDTSADAVSVRGETKLFENGEPTEFTKKALEFCTSFQTQTTLTRSLGKMLAEHDLLVSRQADMTLGDGRKIAVRDFRTIDEEKLGNLADEDFLAFRKNGLLPFLYFQIMSLANFRDLAARVTP